MSATEAAVVAAPGSDRRARARRTAWIIGAVAVALYVFVFIKFGWLS